MIILIAAVNNLNVIGNAGKLPWNCPEDLKFFNTITTPHPIIMGRWTYESLPSPLKDRLNIIVSKTVPHELSGFHNRPPSIRNGKIFVKSAEDAIDVGNKQNTGITFIVGGSQVYSYCLRYKIPDFCIINIINDNTPGDVSFPSYLLNLHYREKKLTPDFIKDLIEAFKKNCMEKVHYNVDAAIHSLSHLMKTSGVFKTGFYEKL